MKLMCITKAQDFLQLEVEPFPEWHEFSSWGTQLLSQAGLNSPLDINEGADRHMLIFTFNQVRFSLNYESYSESVWIASEELASDEHLDALKTLLTPEQLK